jgi:AraC-like DNA-binding protein
VFRGFRIADPHFFSSSGRLAKNAISDYFQSWERHTCGARPGGEILTTAMPLDFGTPAVAPVGAGFDDFATFAADAITPMSIETSRRDGFLARYSAFKLERTSFVQLDVPDLRVYHDANRSSRLTFQLLYAVETGMEICVPGKRFQLRPGEICLLDNGNPYSVEIPARHKAFDMIVPEDWLEGWIADPHAIKSCPISLNTQWGPPLASFLNTLSVEVTAGDIPARSIEYHLGGLISLALRGIADDGPSVQSRAMTRRAIELIRAYHDDPDLTCLKLAKGLGVAPRTLQKALAASSTTYQGLLSEMRIARAKEMLADLGMRKLTISQIAYRAGFADHAYFSRVFTKVTGLPPARWRTLRGCAE